MGASTRVRDEALRPFLEANRMMGTPWLGEQLAMHPKKVAKIMSRLGIPGRVKTGPTAPERNFFWGGGRTVDKTGYVRLHKPDHPRARRGYVLEHRLVMERRLGRFLEPGEVVHHRNGVRDDNRDENLELFASNGPHMRHEWTGRKHSPETREKMRRSALSLWQQRRQERDRGESATLSA